MLASEEEKCKEGKLQVLSWPYSYLKTSKTSLQLFDNEVLYKKCSIIAFYMLSKLCLNPKTSKLSTCMQKHLKKTTALTVVSEKSSPETPTLRKHFQKNFNSLIERILM
jgi:hypothetical protein